MLAHEFMRNALIAGSFVGIACGLVGYFVVLRAQVFAGDALGHVAFTGALAAAVLGLNILAGLFVACILGGLLMGALGDRARADDVVIGSLFAWTLGLGVLFLSIFTTKSSAENGTAGVRVLFGSIFGLSTTDVRTSAVLATLAILLLLAIARPLLTPHSTPQSPPPKASPSGCSDSASSPSSASSLRKPAKPSARSSSSVFSPPRPAPPTGSPQVPTAACSSPP